MKTIRDEIDNGNVFVYSDTDSIWIIENKKPVFKIDEDELGCWKCEGRFTNWCYPLKRKRYYAWNKFLEEGHKKKYKITCGGFSKGILKDLSHEERMLFFNPDINCCVIEGKLARYLGDVHRPRRGEEVQLNRYGLCKLFAIDIVTKSIKDRIDYYIKLENNKWTMTKA